VNTVTKLLVGQEEVVGCYEHGDETSGFIKYRAFFFSAEKLTVSQQALCSVYLVMHISRCITKFVQLIFNSLPNRLYLPESKIFHLYWILKNNSSPP
jgi:hypothetical protein